MVEGATRQILEVEIGRAMLESQGDESASASRSDSSGEEIPVPASSRCFQKTPSPSALFSGPWQTDCLALADREKLAAILMFDAGA